MSMFATVTNLEITGTEINRLITSNEYMIPHGGLAVSATDRDTSFVEKAGNQYQINVPKKLLEGLRCGDLDLVKVGVKKEVNVSIEDIATFNTVFWKKEVKITNQ